MDVGNAPSFRCPACRKFCFSEINYSQKESFFEKDVEKPGRVSFLCVGAGVLARLRVDFVSVSLTSVKQKV